MSMTTHSTSGPSRAAHGPVITNGASCGGGSQPGVKVELALTGPAIEAAP